MHRSTFKSILRINLHLLLLALGTLLGYTAHATHIRAGDIVARSLSNPLRFEFEMVLYTDPTSGIDQTTATFFFGDGTSAVVNRASETNLGNQVIKNVYIVQHQYNAPGYYRVSFAEENRNAGIVNIPNSSQQSFYIDTEVFVNPLVGANETPRLGVPPLDRAVKGQVFEHNPQAFDAEGDSLAYKMIVPRQSPVSSPSPSPVTGYTSPADPIHGGVSTTGGPAFIVQDINTGLIEWNTPGRLGEYNIAFVVEEWRLIERGRPRIKMSVTTRDMQILVKEDPNHKPEIKVPKDICVIPGTVIIDTITVSDPDNNPVVLQNFFPVTVATLTRIGSSNAYRFTWIVPECEDIRMEPYQFVFRATDVPPANQTALTDFATWNIRVVGPPPQNLVVTPQNQNMNLTWDPYTCQNGERITIWRKENPFPFIPDSCELGVPAYTGYRKIGQVPVTATAYTDDNNGRGLRRGILYCYLLAVEFPVPGAGESYASNEACNDLIQDAPVITNVSANTPAPENESLTIKWLAPTEGLDQLISPFRYSLMRAEGQTGAGPYTEVFTTTNLNDTSFTDTNVDLENKTYTYRVDFYISSPIPEPQPSILHSSSDSASSVRLEATSINPGIELTWTYNTPWDNSQHYHYIYRKINNAYTLIDSAFVTGTAGNYTDNGTFQNIPLKERQTYCYYVQTVGDYPSDSLPQNLVNLSQVQCVLYKDVTPPCPPVLTLAELNCENFTQLPPYSNNLSWQLQAAEGCDTTDIAYFTVYYSPQTGSPLDSIAFTSLHTFVHSNLISQAGCYAVTATDSVGNTSQLSNIACHDNCFVFGLPNIITPNSDGLNEVFKPLPNSRFVKKFEVIIFNRWGAKVFTSTTAEGVWAGQDQSGNALPDGIYYYLADVEFYTLNPSQSTRQYKGWVEVVR